MSTDAALAYSVLLLVFIGGHQFGKPRGWPAANPVTVFAGPWLVLLAVCLVPGSTTPQFDDYPILLALLAATAIGAGAFTASCLSVSSRRGPSVNESHIRALVRVHRWTVFLLIGFVALEVWRAWPVISSLGGVNAIWSGAGGEFRAAQRLARIEAVSTGGSLPMSVLGYGLFLGHISFITGGVLWRAGRRALAVAPIVVLLLHALVTLERTTFAIGALLFLFTASAARSFRLEGAARREPSSQRGVVARVLVVVVTFAALLIPLSARNAQGDNSTGLISLVQYAMSGVVGLNSRAQEVGGLAAKPVDPVTGEVGTVPGYGAYTFYSLYDLGSRFGAPTPFAPRSSSYSSVQIFGDPFNTNIATVLADWYQDGGTWAIAFFGAVLGFGATLTLRLVRAGNFAWLATYAVLMSAIAWSFFGNAVLTDVRYGLVALAAVVVVPLRGGRRKAGNHACPSGSRSP